MRKLAVLHARISLNPVYATLFVLTSLTLALTGLGLYGSETLIQNTPVIGWLAKQAATHIGFVFGYLNPVWYLNNMVPIFWAGTAFAALNILVVFSSPYLLRGEKELKLKSHFDFKHVIRSLFPTVVFVTYPMLLAKGLAGSGIEGVAGFKEQADAMAFFADNVLIYGFIAAGIQIVHGSAFAFMKRAYDRHIALSESGSLEADLKAAGIDTEGLGNKLKGMSPKQLAKLKIAAQQGAATRKLKEEQAAEQAALLRQTSEEDQANQAALQKLLGQSAASEEASSGVQTPKKPVLIELEEGEAEEVSPSDAPQQA